MSMIADQRGNRGLEQYCTSSQVHPDMALPSTPAPASKGIEMSNPTELPDLDRLTRFGWKEAYIGDTPELVEDPEGTYVRFDDVAALARRAQPEGEVIPGKHAVFPINLLGAPMREFAPGKWESAVWPSDKPEGEAPQAWMRITDITEWADTEPETEGWTPLFTRAPAAQHAESGAPAAAGDLEAFAAWKAYPLPNLNSDGHFDKDWLHREFVAFKAGRRAALAAQSQGEQATHCDPAEGFCAACREQERAARSQGAQATSIDGLPPLPQGEKAYEYTGTTIVYSAEQFRQGQRDAVAADRARRGEKS